MSSSSQNAASCEASGASEPLPLRMVLLGRTGSGRSSSGNTILGRAAFRADVSPSSVTERCQRRSGTVDGRSVSVTDTPGFFHTTLPPREVMAEVGRSVALSSPGPHAFLLTLRPGRFTPEEREALDWTRATFGPQVGRFTLVLFTWGDQLGGKDTRDFLEESPELTELVSSCRGGHHVLDNTRQGGTTEQVLELLDKVEKMVAENGGVCYSGQMFQEAEAAVREAQERVVGTGQERALVSEAQERAVNGSPERTTGEAELRSREAELRSREEAELQRRAERLFWCELVTALGQGAAEGAGLQDKGKPMAVTKVKAAQTVASLAASPLSVTSAAKMVGGAMREGGKVLYKHRKTFLPKSR